MGHSHSIKSRSPVWLRQMRSQVSVGSVNEIDIVRDISRRFEQAGLLRATTHDPTAWTRGLGLDNLLKEYWHD
jgi:hypothetical protein